MKLGEITVFYTVLANKHEFLANEHELLFYSLACLPLFGSYCFIIVTAAATKIYVIHRKSH